VKKWLAREQDKEKPWLAKKDELVEFDSFTLT
jgi:hypothetical protein